MAKRKKYQDYYELYVKAHPNLSKQRCHEEIIASWNLMKDGGKQVDEEKYSKEVIRLKMKLNVKKNSMFEYLYKSKCDKKSNSSSSSDGNDAAVSICVESPSGESATTPANISTPGSNDSPVSSGSVIQIDDNDLPTDLETALDKDVPSDNESGDDNGSLERVFEKPAQERLENERADMDARLVALNEARNLGIGEDNVANITKQIKVLTEKRKQVVRKIKIAKSNQKASKKLREKKKRQMAQAIVDFPSLSNTLKVRDSVGKPPIEDVYPNLHADILNIATIGAAASDRRRQNLYRTVKTLDQLHSALSDLGYRLSRQTVYLRLLPKSASSSHGKTHVRTVPVR